MCKKTISLSIYKKKGSKLDCGNYRGVDLIFVQSRMFMRVLLNKIKPKIDDGLREEQTGFSGGRSTVK